jgi:hypothetical protein
MRIFILITVVFTLTACNKRNSKKWFVETSEFSTGCLVQVNTNFDTHFKEPLVYSSNCEGYVFEETQLVNRIFNGSVRQSFLLELPNDTNDFHFQNIEILSNTKFYIFNSTDFTFYRIAKGWIKGNYVNGYWDVDFDLSYGGKKNDKFRIKKGANY